MHKKAIFEDKKTQDAFLLKAKGLGYNEEETKVMFNYF